MDFYPNYHKTGRLMKRAAQDEYYGAIIRYYFEGIEPEFKNAEAAIGFQAITPSLEKQRAGRVAGLASSAARSTNCATDATTDGITEPATDYTTDESTEQPTNGAADGEQATSEQAYKRTSIVKTPKAPFEEIVSYLNDRTGRRYSPKSQETRKHITARLSEGYSLEDFKRVIDNMCGKWLGTKMSEFLRPSTLFRPSHFDEYLNATSPKEDEYAQYNR